MKVYHSLKMVLVWYFLGYLSVSGNPDQIKDTSSLSTVSDIASITQQVASIAMLSTAAVAAYYAIQKYKNDVRKPPRTVNVHMLSDSFKSLGGKPPKEVRCLMEYIQNPQTRERYKKFNVTPYKGILLYGPPGTGKTALARAIAGEAGVPFFHQKPSDILDRWIGGSEGNIARIFGKAREAARESPAGMAIIFFDEFDAIAGKRLQDKHSCVPQILTELDGFEANSGVLVIAATNKKDTLDEAVIRQGRFDATISIGLPSMNKQKEILKTCLKNTLYEHRGDDKAMEECIEHLLKKLGYSVVITPALLAGLVHEAARRTAHQGKVDFITDKMLGEVFDEHVRKIPKPSDSVHS